MPKDLHFEVALSFAGEQRPYVKQVALTLRNRRVRVFFDEFYETEMWGENLPEFLNSIYEKKCDYCVMFISKEYATKYYPTHEKRSALSDQIKVLEGRILPVKFDDTDLPGVPSSTMHLSAERDTPEQIAEKIIKKIRG